MQSNAKYGIGIYGVSIYGVSDVDKGKPKYVYKSIPLGVWVRKQINHDKIFRVCRGNGYAGSVAGSLYQQRYDYFVPNSITHVNGDASRACLKDAVSAWQALSAEEKAVYDDAIRKDSGMSGYNLFIQEYMNENYVP